MYVGSGTSYENLNFAVLPGFIFRQFRFGMTLAMMSIPTSSHLLFTQRLMIQRVALVAPVLFFVCGVCTAQPHSASSQDPLDHQSYSEVADGWRMTRNGWEHTTSWDLIAMGSAIGGSIANESAPSNQPPAWIQYLGSTHPSLIASFQLLMAIGLLRLGGNQRLA